MREAERIVLITLQDAYRVALTAAHFSSQGPSIVARGRGVTRRHEAEVRVRFLENDGPVWGSYTIYLILDFRERSCSRDRYFESFFLAVLVVESRVHRVSRMSAIIPSKP